MKDLFAFRRESFNAILSKYPKAEGASDYIRTKLESGNVPLERILKELVYKLYGLTDEEIKIVEGVHK